MTREEAIGHIKDVICENNTIKPNIVVFEQEKEALYMAIKSLEAWDKVLADLDNAKVDYPDRYGFDGGIKAARDIIEKHMGAL